ncbi:MAG: glycosyltransferase [Verrucomicrobia bacterium]|nr:glycosyltransferase [Verrucomicrobiota bacterium]
MNIIILAVGSRGDVQPYVAVGLGLQNAGHHVRMATHSNFKDFVEMRGLEFAEIKGNPKEWLDTEEGLDWLESGPGLYKFYTGLKRFMEPVLESLLPTSLSACRDMDVILYSTVATSGPHIGEKLGLPTFPLMLQPAYPTGDFPSVIADSATTKNRIYNQFTHWITDQILHHSTRGSIDRWRKEVLGLSRATFLGPARVSRKKRVPHFLGYSPSVVPRPKAWGDHVQVTGYWFLDREENWVPPDELVRFLESGSPPVYVGFGSMTVRKSEETTRMIVSALQMTGHRGILLKGWGNLGSTNLPDSVLQIDSVPHDWLFPRMAAIVHHGGAGTTGAAIRAGVPSIITPFFADQIFWAARISSLGVGPASIPFSKLNDQNLADAIRLATGDSAMRGRSKALSEKICSENGVTRVVEAFENAIRSPRTNGNFTL